jgi:ubiquinone/menaquinone biosynthesis C-methylase UbiE
MTTIQTPLDRPNFEHPAIWTQVAEDYTEALLPIFQCYANHALGLVDLDGSMRVLDLACGPGTITLPLLERVSAVDAVDFSPKMLDCLRRRVGPIEHSRLRCHLMDGHRLDFGDACFDAAFSMFGVVHFADPARGLRELFRVLRPNATLVAATWAAPRESTLNQLGADVLRRAFDGLPPDDQIFHGGRSPEQWVSELAAAGFVDTHSDELSFDMHLQSPEQYWGNMSRASVPLVLLRNAASVEQWERASQSALDYLRQQSPWPHPVRVKGYFFVGRVPR